MTGDRRGLTLIEILVTLAIFSLSTMLVSFLFMNYLKDNNRLLAYQDLSNNGRFILVMIIQEVRQKEITTATADTLTLADGTVFRLVGTNLLRNDDRINQTNIRVTNIDFYYSNVAQPFLTMMISLEKDSWKGGTVSLDLQTTISSRIYE